jgi:malonyl-ACP decarboxylase
MAELGITGLGIISPLGQGGAAVTQALLAGVQRFGVMQRPGRQIGDSAFLGAELAALDIPSKVPPKMARTASLSTQAALAVVDEAWIDARLGDVPGERIGLIVGGSNFQQRELALAHDAWRERPVFLRPSYGQTFMDSDLCGACSEVFGIRGFAYSVGGASASGQLAVIHAAQAVLAGQVDACIAVGALMDLSYWECQALRSLGAMGSERYRDQPTMACRPFDLTRDGFIFSESCGAVVVERCGRAGVRPWAVIRGWSVKVDGHRGPEPSLDGESHVIRQALAQAELSANAIDYVNPHGSGSIVGDETEIKALRGCGLGQAWINTSKSLLGHGLSAAGTVELIATLLQMRAGRLHPSLNLNEPISSELRWVGERAVDHRINRAMSLSFGFGGINTAVCVENAGLHEAFSQTR